MERKVMEEKHRSNSDPESIRLATNLERFNILAANPSVRPRDLAGLSVRPGYGPPAPGYGQPYMPAPIIIQQPAPAPAPAQDDKIRELQSKLAGVESDNKKLEEQMRNALIMENPRLLQAFYPIGRPLYNPRNLLNAALEAELEKSRQASQTYSKLKDIYGEDAASKYVERSMSRLADETAKEAARRFEPVKYEYVTDKPTQRHVTDKPTQRKSPPRARVRSRSPTKKKTSVKSPAKKPKNKSKK